MLNKWTGIGNLGADPEMRFLPNQTAVTTISLATTRSWKKDGEKVSETEWVRVVFFGKLAEIVSEYTKKGSKLYVEGRLKTRSWEKDGQKHYATEIIANDMLMLDGNRREADEEARGGEKTGKAYQSSGQTSNNAQARNNEPPMPDYADFDDTDIPF